MDSPHSRTLKRALEIAGSRERLAEALDIPVGDMELYLSGEKRLAPPVYLIALDVVAKGKITDPGSGPGAKGNKPDKR